MSSLGSGASRRGDAPARRIGETMVARGAVGPDAVAAAVAAQDESGARLGAILAARGWARAGAVAEALAEQAGLQAADLEANPLDPELLDPADLETCLRWRVAPWRRAGDRIVWAAVDIAAAAEGLSRLAAPPERAALALASPEAFESAFSAAHGPALARRAETRAPEALSARAPASRLMIAALALLALPASAAFALAPALTTAWLFLGLVAVNAMNGALRISALGAALARPAVDPGPVSEGSVPRIADRRGLPIVSLLIALNREAETVPVLLDALERLDWPPERLDVKLILEADDAETRAALRRHRPPSFCRILTIPEGDPRTKPRALNYALDFAEGEIVGVYDAEDRPAPDQIRRVVRTLAASGPEVGCVQCRLTYFNSDDNWLTRCFTLEYALWFDVLLDGYRALRLPIPLGGTSVFFRRAALESVGAWDAHNVTEDADLGMRLARYGYRVELVASSTAEEANGRIGPWIKQRSRWLKGYAQTWMTHMRRPARLWRELGTRRFLGFHAILLGGLAAYFGLPVFWGVWASALWWDGPSWLAETPVWAFGALATLHLSAWIATFAAAVIAARRRERLWLLPWAPTLFLYWPLGAAAAALALAELAVAPSYWRKTRHGVGPAAAAARARAVADRSREPRAASRCPAPTPIAAAASRTPTPLQ